MAAESGMEAAGVAPSPPPPPTELGEDPTAFEFFQAVRLLERARGGQRRVGGFGDPDDEVARFSAHPSTAFPASEIQALELPPGAPARLSVNFLGLIGPLGVLPYHYTLLVVERLRARDRALQAFLDIFNHRITSLFYRAFLPRGDRSVAVLALLSGFLVGTLEEWVQWLVPTRTGVAEDVYLNLFALVCGLCFAAGLLGHSVVEIASRAFYAQQDTRTPVLVGTGAMGLNVILSLTLPGLFARVGWMPHGGLALANSAATFLEMLILLYIMNKRLHGLEAGRLWLGLVQATLGSLVMGIVIFAWLAFAGARPNWLLAIGGISLGLLFYGGISWIQKIPELNDFLISIRKRLKLIGSNS